MQAITSFIWVLFLISKYSPLSIILARAALYAFLRSAALFNTFEDLAAFTDWAEG